MTGHLAGIVLDIAAGRPAETNADSRIKVIVNKRGLPFIIRPQGLAFSCGARRFRLKGRTFISRNMLSRLVRRRRRDTLLTDGLKELGSVSVLLKLYYLISAEGKEVGELRSDIRSGLLIGAAVITMTDDGIAGVQNSLG